MKIYSTLFLLIAMLATGSAFAQKIKWEKGEDLAFLKGEKQLAVVYDYSKITVKGASEATYLQAQKEDLNKDKAGEGDAFVTEWTEARDKKYQQHFETEFNNVMKKEGMIIAAGTEAKYTVILVTNDMNLGRGSTFVKKPAKVTYTILIVETANKENILAKGTLEEVEGEVKAPKGSSWIPGGAGTVMSITANVQNHQYTNRIAESYEKAGGILARYIRKHS